MTIKIAVASGKGGTGKTMVATSLASTLSNHLKVQFLDCDVEAPNAHLFLKPTITQTQPAVINIPEVDEARCTACRKCVEVCEYNAIAMLGEKILVFPQLCHGCGSCTLNCPVNAISEKPRAIGSLNHGKTTEGISFYMGELTISEPMPTPIIHQLKELAVTKDPIRILDSPPGASCAVVATIHDADFVLLVTEPTPFGLHDLKQMLGILEQTHSPAGVIINRNGIGDDALERFLTKTHYPILMKIPYRSTIAIGLSAGQVLTDFMPEYKTKFLDVYDHIKSNLARKDQPQ